MATDVRGLAKDYRVTPASEHDSKRFDELTEDETKAKYGDTPATRPLTDLKSRCTPDRL